MRWAISFPASSLPFATTLRTKDVVAATCDDVIWLSGTDSDEATELISRCIPGAIRFRVGGDNELFQVGTSVPCGTLPTIKWSRFEEWLTLKFPRSGLPGTDVGRVSIRLERCVPEDGTTAATLLITDKDASVKFAISASAIRLKPLQFAVSNDGRVMIKGSPLPSISGDRYWMRGRVAVPVGYSWLPAVSEDVVRQAMSVSDGEMLVLHNDGTCDQIEDGAFVQVTRAALRASCGG